MTGRAKARDVGCKGGIFQLAPSIVQGHHFTRGPQLKGARGAPFLRGPYIL